MVLLAFGCQCPRTTLDAQIPATTVPPGPINQIVLSTVATGRHKVQRWPLLTDVAADLRAVYAVPAGEPVWSDGGTATAPARLVIQQLSMIEARGLRPSDYDVVRLNQLASSALATPQAQAEFDLMLSTAAIRALRSLRFGRVSAKAAHASLGFPREVYDVIAAVRTMARSANPSLQFDQAEPPFLHYHLLKDALARYRSAVGDSSVRVEVGGGTLTKAARDSASRIARMVLTLERWRWLPHSIGDPPPIIVNIPAFRLHAFTATTDRESDLISMDVVVGRAYNHRTPVFSGAMRYLIFAPYWDIPPSIMRKEIIPKARRDSRYLARNHYEVVSNSGRVLGTSASAVSAAAAGQARIRQRPGADNALGRVKFIFPNDFNVYMHDTPAQQIFARVRRDASHGCIRLAEPARLARFLLRDQPAWDSTAIETAMRETTPHQVNLSRPVPVHIVYATTVAREDGEVLFYDDIYGHDRTLTALLAKGYPYANSPR